MHKKTEQIATANEKFSFQLLLERVEGCCWWHIQLLLRSLIYVFVTENHRRPTEAC